LPLRRAAAGIAVDGVDTRGVVGTAIVTAIVDVDLAVVSVETCHPATTEFHTHTHVPSDNWRYIPHPAPLQNSSTYG